MVMVAAAVVVTNPKTVLQHFVCDRGIVPKGAAVQNAGPVLQAPGQPLSLQRKRVNLGSFVSCR